MKKTTLNEWFYLLGFLVFGGAAFALYYLGAERFAADDSLSAQASRLSTLGVMSADKQGRILLNLGEPTVVGDIRIVYRGIEADGKARLDIALMELDPQKFYPYRFSPQPAPAAVVMAGRRYRPEHVGKKRLELIRLGGERQGY